MRYAGVGARATPTAVLALMEAVGKECAGSWILRSGGAPGADSAFERGCRGAGGQMEVWNPRRGMVVEHPWALELADRAAVRPLASMSPFVRNLMVRNAYILCGEGGDSVVQWLCCWTPGGAVVGGTGHTLRMAAELGVPVWNLADSGVLARFRRRLGV